MQIMFHIYYGLENIHHLFHFNPILHLVGCTEGTYAIGGEISLSLTITSPLPTLPIVNSDQCIPTLARHMLHFVNQLHDTLCVLG